MMPRWFSMCTIDSHHDLPITPNRLDQESVASRPNQVWLADMIYMPAEEGELYLAVLVDLFNRKIVGWAMRDHIRAELTITAPTTAIQRQKPASSRIHHSVRGNQYAAADCRKVLGNASMVQSMSRKGNCWDNAPMESCFGSLKTELAHQACYPTRNAAQARLVRLHRRILQSPAAAFCARVHHPRTGRTPSRLTGVHDSGGRSSSASTSAKALSSTCWMPPVTPSRARRATSAPISCREPSCNPTRPALEPIQEEGIHVQGLGLVKRLSMMRIMARRTKAARVVS